MTAREFALALEAYEENLKAENENMKWQTAHLVWSNLAPWKKGVTVRSILAGWKPARTEDGKPQKTPMDFARERFFEELKKKNGGTAAHS